MREVLGWQERVVCFNFDVILNQGVTVWQDMSYRTRRLLIQKKFCLFYVRSQSLPRLIFVAIFLLHVLTAIAGDTPEYSAVKNIVLEFYPHQGYEPDGFAYGDLNSDGNKDLVVLLTDPEIYRGRRIAVLLGTSADGYRLVATSENVGSSRGHPEVYVVDGLIELQDAASSGCCSRWSHTMTFRMIENRPLLVAEDWHSSEELGEKESEGGSSADYLERRITYWKRIGKKQRTINKIIPKFKLLDLGEIGENYQDLLPKETRVYLDDHFRLVQ